jgi:AAA+ superfamily predicted ATPase
MEPYRDSIDHLTDELKRVDVLLRRAMTIARDRTQGDREYRGLVISENEIDELLESGEFLQQYWRKQDKSHDKLEALDEKVSEVRKSIDERRDLTARTGRSLTLPRLAELFRLSAAEVDLLLLAMAPELEPRYETLYAYLQDDVTRKRPSVDLALNLICRSEREKVIARRLLAPGAPLIHFRMLELIEEQHDREPTLLRKFLKVEDSLLRFLLEQAPTALALGSFAVPHATIDTLEVDEDTRRRLRNLTNAVKRSGVSSSIIRVVGSGREELQQLAEALSDAYRRPMIAVDEKTLENAGALHALIRDVALYDAMLAVFANESSEAAAAPAESPRASHGLDPFWRSLEKLPIHTILLGPEGTFGGIPPESNMWRIEVQPPGFERRLDSWKAALGDKSGNVDAERLADTFRFGGSQIRQAVSLGQSLAGLRDSANPAPSTGDLLEAGRSMSAANLRRFATVIEPRYTWSDIVLPDEKRHQLEHIAARVKNRRTVHSDWGFGEKLSRGKGLNVIFAGQSGVGKTMAAEVLANELSVVLFQIDLSSVVSKYIGETEKHLAAIFREAEMSQSLLFFDEADSLFGKRTEVKDAHDRYANIEVNYLLQRIEQYEGLIILATNMQRNLDDAFVRRMQEVIDFPFPDEALRERIWRRHIPDSAPVEARIDYGFLAKQFKMTGGEIKNAVMSAAFLAASMNNKIGMAEMIRGVRMELQKQGKLMMKSDFGKYFESAQGLPGTVSTARN